MKRNTVNPVDRDNSFLYFDFTLPFSSDASSTDATTGGSPIGVLAPNDNTNFLTTNAFGSGNSDNSNSDNSGNKDNSGGGFGDTFLGGFLTSDNFGKLLGTATTMIGGQSSSGGSHSGGGTTGGGGTTKGGTLPITPKKNNTWVYVTIGAGVLALTTVGIILATKNK